MSEIQSQSSVDVLGAAKEWMGRVCVGEGMHHRNLTVFPLLVKGPDDLEEGPQEGDRYVLLSDAIESVKDGLIMYDRDDRIVLVNDCANGNAAELASKDGSYMVKRRSGFGAHGFGDAFFDLKKAIIEDPLFATWLEKVRSD